MRTNKQKLLLAAKILFAVLLIVVGGFIFFRDSLLNQALDKVSTKMTQQYNSNFTVKKASFDGLNGIDLYDVVLAPKNADTLLNIKKLKTSISFWNLFIGNIQLQSLELQEGYIQLVKKGKVKNFDAFLKKGSEVLKNFGPFFVQEALKSLETEFRIDLRHIAIPASVVEP